MNYLRPNFYDYLKILAIITMIIDHMGYFLYPDVVELRLIGRFAFPLFFLLIGRNQSSKIGSSLIVAAILIQASLWYLSRFHGYSLRQLNILPAAIIVKLLIGSGKYIRNNIAPKFNTSKIDINNIVGITMLVGLILACVLTISRTKDYIEYGSMTLGMALVGLFLHKYKSQWSIIWILIILSLYGLKKINMHFPFDASQRIVVYISWIIGIVSVRTMSYRNASFHFNLIWDKLILLLSKYAVWVYVVHFLILLGMRVMR